MVRNLEKRFKNSLTMNTGSRNAVMVSYRGIMAIRCFFCCVFNRRLIFRPHLSCSLCQKPSLSGDLVEPFRH
ncbi:hypothetical protein CWM58_02715 [Klebsiella sp. H-Nf2]|nr:hypothetical protein CWM58_02715 [Klebsiella sp. H-Nf2]